MTETPSKSPTRSPGKSIRRGLATTAIVATLVAMHGPAAAQTAAEQKCMTSLNKSGAKVASTQGKEDVGCVKNAGKGKELNATACLTADGKGKVAKAVTKVGETYTKSCPTMPPYGPTSATTISNAAKTETIALATDLFGSDLTGALVLSSTNADAAKCQSALASGTQKMADQIIKDFNACKSAGLKDASINSADALAECFDTVNADAKGKVVAAFLKLRSSITKSCTGLDTDALLPGFCEGYSALSNCLSTRARCRACTAIAEMDGLGNVCDRFDDGLPANGSCGTPIITSERISLPSGAEPVHTPGSTGVVVTNPKLLTQFPPSGPDLNRADYVRWRLSGPDVAPDVILILVPGFGAGVNIFRVLAEDQIPRMLADKGIRMEIWGFSRRDDVLEDREGTIIATQKKDPAIAQDWFYGTELGLTLHPDLVAGPNRRAVFYNTSSDIPFLADFTPQVFSRDIDAVVEAARAITPNVFLGGHSAGTGFAARYASTDFNLTGMGPPEPGYSKLKGIVLFEGGGGTTAASSPLSADTLDRIIAKADGGLFGAVRDNAARCVDGLTACTIANEAVDCVSQVPPKCTLPTTSYTALGGLQPQLYAAGEIGGVQGIKDPETGQVIIQVDQGSPGNNAIAMVPGLSPLGAVADSTVEGLFGIFLDDDGQGVLLSPALATSMGATGPGVGGLVTWIDIDGDGLIPFASRPNNGPAPTTLPGGIWGQEVEVTRMDRHRMSFIAEGENSSDWYYAGSGLSTLGVTGVCTLGTCTVGKSGSCMTNSECSQSISLDSTALSVGRLRPDIANMTQAPNIDIPVISFGGSNGLTPIGASYLGFGQSIGTCTAPSCDGSTGRVVNATLPNPAFPTYGNIAGGYEVYISEGYAHVDVVTAEDTADNLIPERLGAFLERNME